MKHILLCAAVLFAGLPCLAQNNSPSEAEIDELVHKADEKVTGFEKALQVAKPFLPEEKFRNDTDVASTAHLLIHDVNKYGPSAYRLVALIITLDDVVINAGQHSQGILKDGLQSVAAGKALGTGPLSAVLLLNNAAAGCNDISELIGHATLRLISVEEKALLAAPAK
ncbi:MAG: hypothetical protein ACRD50_15345 [Candidatus Acidiferrales bacterium]